MAQFAPESLAQFAPDLVAQFAPDLVAQFDRNIHLNNLVPGLVQQLLENCTSVKVKRLFLYLAEKSDHEWVKFLNKEKIDLGKGKRSFAKKGVYVPQYQITVSKDLEDYELPEV